MTARSSLSGGYLYFLSVSLTSTRSFARTDSFTVQSSETAEIDHRIQFPADCDDANGLFIRQSGLNRRSFTERARDSR